MDAAWLSLFPSEHPRTSAVEFDLLCAFECHSVDEIRAILDAGFDIHAPIYANIERLLVAAGRGLPPLSNVPNRDLEPGVSGPLKWRVRGVTEFAALPRFPSVGRCRMRRHEPDSQGIIFATRVA